MKIKNTIREKIRQGIPITMAFLCTKDANIAELYALCGIDGVVLDNEHFTFTEGDISDILRALEPYATTVLLRTVNRDPGYLSRMMELGIGGIMPQQIKTPEQVKEILKAVKYYPEGNRGIGMSRALSFGVDLDKAAYMKEANDNVVVIPVVEDLEGASNAGAIASIPGIDSVNVGPMDLSLSMGYGGESTPEVREIVDKAHADVRANGGVYAEFAMTAESVPELIRNGAKFILLGTEHQMLLGHLQPIMSAFHQALEEDVK